MDASIAAFVDEVVKLAEEPAAQPVSRGPLIERIPGQGKDRVLGIGSGSMPGTFRVYTPKGTTATPGGLYQATRQSRLASTRMMGGNLRRHQMESRIGSLGGAAVGAGGGLALMRHVVPRGGKLGLLASGLGILGSGLAGSALGGGVGQYLAHRRLMNAPAVQPRE